MVRSSKFRVALAFVCLATVQLAISSRALAQTEVLGFGEQVFNSAWNEESFVEVAAGRHHSVARRSDGSVVAWGGNWGGQCDVPPLPPGLSYVEVAGGGGWRGPHRRAP